MSESFFTRVSNVEEANPIDPEKPQTWIRAEIVLNEEVVSTGIAPERPPYVEGTARSSAISRAQIDFMINFMGKDIREVPGFKEKLVIGVS